MAWYYAQGTEKVGPIDDAEFESRRRSGQILPTDLVWKDGMADWVKLESLAGGSQPCAECGKLYSPDELISYQGFKVCAECKPAFMQKLKEGLNVGGQLNYAGFWTRFGAVWLDAIILYVVNLPLSMVIGFAKSQSDVLGAGSTLLTLLPAGVSLILGISYETFMIGRFGYTLGKKAVGVRVIGEDGAKISYGRAAGRYLAKILDYFTLTIGFIMAAWDPKKQALHDRICSTYVVKG